MCDITNPAFTDEDKAREFLEASRWPNGAFCPHCGQLETVKPLGGKSMGPGWYYCSDCREKFTVRVGTLYERSHIPLHKWLFATHLMVSSMLHFSGYEWEIRGVPSNRGGAENNCDPNNAWTDAEGKLHLRIARGSGEWTCAEVTLTRSLGYGSYSFDVRDVSALQPAAVLGLFTWDDSMTDVNHREVDIEISRWGDPSNKNLQYVVQPNYIPANVVRFSAPPGRLTYSFYWQPGRVTFKTVRRPGGETVAEHTFTSGVPLPGGEALHMNLYPFANKNSSFQTPVEVVIEKFEYLP